MALCVCPRIASNRRDRICTLPGKREKAMKYSNRRCHQGAESRRPTSMDLNPYVIEDMAMAVGELEPARATGPKVLVASR